MKVNNPIKKAKEEMYYKKRLKLWEAAFSDYSSKVPIMKLPIIMNSLPIK